MELLLASPLLPLLTVPCLKKWHQQAFIQAETLCVILNYFFLYNYSSNISTNPVGSTLKMQYTHNIKIATNSNALSLTLSCDHCTGLGVILLNMCHIKALNGFPSHTRIIP